MRRIVDLKELEYVVNCIVETGRVVNGVGLAKLIGVNKGTITRNLQKLTIQLPKTNGRNEPSTDNEPRTNAEIARLMQIEISKENPGKPYSDTKLMELVNFNGKLRNFTKIRNKYGIHCSRKRKMRQ